VNEKRNSTKGYNMMMNIQRSGISYAKFWHIHYRMYVARIRLYLIARITMTCVSLETGGIVDILRSFLYLPLIKEQDVHMHHDQLPSTTPSEDAFDYEQLILRLCDLNEELSGQSEGVIERISQEITRLSRGFLSVRWHQPGAAPPRSGPLSSPPSVPLHYGGRYYGELVSAVDPARPATPLVPLLRAQVVANMCGWLIYSLEVAALLGKQRLLSQQFEPLSTREQEVLLLMAENLDTQTIARLLEIAPATVRKHRESIYRRLGVKTVPDAVLTGFLMAHYSPLALLTPHLGNPYEKPDARSNGASKVK
jgi:DNA-binding CsgD family transcriptional regulator